MNARATITPIQNPAAIQQALQNHVFGTKNAESVDLRGFDGVTTGQQQASDMADILVSMMTALDRRQAEINASCIALINQINRNPLVIAQMRRSVKDSGLADYSGFALGIKSMLEGFDAGEALSVTTYIKAINDAVPALSVRFLTDRIKPMLESLGLILKSGNGFRWADLAEIEATLAEKNQQAGIVQPESRADAFKRVCKSPMTNLQKAKAQRAIQKAKRDPWMHVTADGEIQYRSKPLEGELTEKEKSIIRENERAKAFSKLLKETEKLKSRQTLSEEVKADQQLQSQAREIMAQAHLEATEIRARREVSRANLESYKPVVIGFFIVATVIFLIGQNQQAGQTQTIEYATMPDTPSIWESEE